ncbi:MAG: hypothetical protein AAF648_12675 [Pseudomonadota bacterium]
MSCDSTHDTAVHTAAAPGAHTNEDNAMSPMTHELIDLAESNHQELDALTLTGWPQDGAAAVLRADAWERVAQRHQPAGLRFRW